MKRFLQIIAAIFILSAAFSAQQTPVALEKDKAIERELKAGETHDYQIELKAGEFLNAAVNQRGIDVVVRVFAPDNAKIAEVDSPNEDQGDEPIALEAKSDGIYRIEISSLDKTVPTGRYEIRINELVPADVYAVRVAENKRKQQSVIKWLKENQMPIKTVEAGNGFDDLQPLKRVFKDVRFVGLGEETHGTREFFQFKHRMVEFLVREMGFRVFAIEASASDCENINDYVMGKTDDGAKALEGQGFSILNTEEVRALIDWMRTYNASVPADKRVKFVGFDIQVNHKNKAELLNYLKRVAPQRAASTEAFFNVNDRLLANTTFLENGDANKETLAKLTELKNKYNELFVFLEINGANLAAKSSLTEYERMREYARVLVQYLDVFTNADFAEGPARRDVYMADNFRRLVAREPAGTKCILWAHNLHITTGSNNELPTFGNYLRHFYGNEYYALGASFNQGAFQACDAGEPDVTKRKMTVFTVGAAVSDSVDWYLAQTGASKFVVDFRHNRKPAEISEWLAASHPMRVIGGIYDPSFEGTSFQPVIISKDYDGLFFIDTTTRARPNPSVLNITQTK